MIRFARIPFGQELNGRAGPACPDCAVDRHMIHHAGCLEEECPRCGRQLVSCPCDLEVKGDQLWMMTPSFPRVGSLPC